MVVEKAVNFYRSAGNEEFPAENRDSGGLHFNSYLFMFIGWRNTSNIGLHVWPISINVMEPSQSSRWMMNLYYNRPLEWLQAVRLDSYTTTLEATWRISAERPYSDAVIRRLSMQVFIRSFKGYSVVRSSFSQD